jgi:hypothetical protein
MPIAEIARRVGVTAPTVCYHARRLGVAAERPRRYDWSEVQALHDSGASFRECRSRFGFSAGAWHAAVKRGDLKPRPAATPLRELLVDGRAVHRGSLKRRLVAAGLKQGLCEECGIGEWRGQPIGLALHHVNGKADDNRLENLQLLCPNCHSLTDNFAGRNAGRRGSQADLAQPHRT